MTDLPPPSPEALAHSETLCERLAGDIRAAGGWLPFDTFMAGLLYTPGLGYYAAGAQKFGVAGDFVTAPEMTPLFGQTLAGQVAQLMTLSASEIIEVGAGSGRLAADLLAELERLGALPHRYAILDVSADLRERQRATLARAVPHLIERVVWLDTLPESFAGVVIGNEVLDAMPTHAVAWRAAGIFERGVGLDASGGFTWNERPATGTLLAVARALAAECALPEDYESEIGLASRAWMAEWGRRLQQGALLLIDYGFPRREFYVAQRLGGTLMCHYRHFSHPDPFLYPGLQDVTVHVDFTAMIEAAHGAGLDLLGYASQARFLLNCGLLSRLESLEPGSPAYLRAAGPVNHLLLPHEMGELFKVIAIGRGIDRPLIGFLNGDQSYRL